MGCFNGTTANHESFFVVEVITGTAAVVFQVFRQLLFAGSIQVW